jgi:hypothetical protein
MNACRASCFGAVRGAFSHTDTRSCRSQRMDWSHMYGRLLSTNGHSLHIDVCSHPTDANSHCTTHSVGRDNTHSTHATNTHKNTPHDGETAKTTMVHHPVTTAERSSEPVDLFPSFDYDNLESPVPSPSETPLNSRLARIPEFFQDLHDLPASKGELCSW